MRIAFVSAALAAAVGLAVVFAPTTTKASIASPGFGTVPQATNSIKKAGCWRWGWRGWGWYPWCGGWGPGWGWRHRWGPGWGWRHGWGWRRW